VLLEVGGVALGRFHLGKPICFLLLVSRNFEPGDLVVTCYSFEQSDPGEG
jgi:hypothetical protein